jgi:hypothetical protein
MLALLVRRAATITAATQIAPVPPPARAAAAVPAPRAAAPAAPARAGDPRRRHKKAAVSR